MKFEDTEVFNFNGAIRGMRNAMNSWDKSDSYPKFFDKKDFEDAMKNKEINPDCDFELNDTNEAIISNYVIGKNDLALAQKLIRAGSEHRKFMRQIFVCVDITASLYW